jgi:hypothetical protein
MGSNAGLERTAPAAAPGLSSRGQVRRQRLELRHGPHVVGRLYSLRQLLVGEAAGAVMVTQQFGDALAVRIGRAQAALR